MKYLFLVLIFTCTTTIMQGQDEGTTTSLNQQMDDSSNATYKLFPTRNHWTFIKLNTRNGKMWQVHFSIEEEGYTGEVVLNSSSLLLEDDDVLDGRFTLYPTTNIYNFMLLDQIDGIVYQVQWSMEEKYRMVSIIY